MQLALDIGNSSIKGGLFCGERLEHTFRISHEPASLGPSLRAEVNGRSIGRAGVASVVPGSTRSIVRVLEADGIPVHVVRHDMRLPFDVAYRTPETLGMDRLAAAAAAWTLYGMEQRRSVVALDAGTAFTYEVVEKSGVYLGGTIAPGPALMAHALSRRTAQLPDVALDVPEDVIGGSTAESIQAGVMYGFIDSVKGLLERINGRLGEEAIVVATGGWSGVLLEHLPAVRIADPHLVLRGVQVLVDMNVADQP